MGLGFIGMAVLIVAYFLLACAFVADRQWIFAAYWLCAAGISTCVLLLGLGVK